MKQLSLKSRLIAGAALFIVVALGISGLAFYYLFERSLLWRFESELDANIQRVVAVLKVEDSGRVSFSRPVLDPRFEIPYSGYYWQVSDAGGPLLRSRSLWDFMLEGKEFPEPGGPATQLLLPGPDNQTILARSITVVIEREAETRRLFITAGIDHHELSEYMLQFSYYLWPGFLVLASLLVLASWAQVTVGLQPFRVLSNHLANVRTGSIARLGGTYPIEIEPLVGETNKLLDVHDEALARARERAGKLAHGLKTPLAILAAESRRLNGLGEQQSADQINAQIHTMQRVVERELARARSGADNLHRAPDSNIVVLTRRLVNAMRRLSDSETIEWQLDAPPLLRAQVDEMDFNEILGNLLDNARKWAHGRVEVSLWAEPCGFVLSVADDGPGASDRDKAQIFKHNGYRADPDVPGNGFGLTIARELIDLYGGRIMPGRSNLGGFAVEVHLPMQRRDSKVSSVATLSLPHATRH